MPNTDTQEDAWTLTNGDKTYLIDDEDGWGIVGNFSRFAITLIPGPDGRDRIAFRADTPKIALPSVPRRYSEARG